MQQYCTEPAWRTHEELHEGHMKNCMKDTWRTAWRTHEGHLKYASRCTSEDTSTNNEQEYAKQNSCTSEDAHHQTMEVSDNCYSTQPKGYLMASGSNILAGGHSLLSSSSLELSSTRCSPHTGSSSGPLLLQLLQGVSVNLHTGIEWWQSQLQTGQWEVTTWKTEQHHQHLC